MGGLRLVVLRDNHQLRGPAGPQHPCSRPAAWHGLVRNGLFKYRLCVSNRLRVYVPGFGQGSRPDWHPPRICCCPRVVECGCHGSCIGQLSGRVQLLAIHAGGG